MGAVTARDTARGTMAATRRDRRGSDGISRRDVIRAAAAGGVALALAPRPPRRRPRRRHGAPGRPPATVTGRVFDDADGAARPGLPGVLVSNGRDVAVTDADGRYTLPVTDETVVFVVKPAGYMTPVEPGTLLPRFFYVHQPAGSPAALDLAYEGVAPTGPLPASVDFPLRRQDEPQRFDVVVLTDPQPETDAELDFVRDDVMPALRGTPARFGLTLGDIMFDDLSLYERHNRILGTVGLPWYNIGGNHDLNYQAPDRRHARETFKRVFGPPHYAFAYADAVFVMLDDVDYLGPDRTKPHDAGKYQGKLDDAQLDFVRNLLAHVPEDKLVVVTLHIPLRTYQGDDAAENLDEPRRAPEAAVRPPLHALHVGPHPHDRAPLPRRRRRLHGPGRTTTTSSPPCRAPGGAAPTTTAASRWRTAATARRTASTSCRSTATATRPASCPPRSRTGGRSASRC